MSLADYCGPPRPEGISEWVGCVLFHDGIDLSLTSVWTLAFLGALVGRWTQRRAHRRVTRRPADV